MLSVTLTRHPASTLTHAPAVPALERSLDDESNMKLFVSALPLVFLHSCMPLEENPTLTKPSGKSLSGFYVVRKTSFFTPHKKEIRAISIDLKNDGSFRLCDSGGALVRSLGSSSTGNWNIVPTYGLDWGSRQCWGVQLVTKNDLVITADCLGNERPDKLLIRGAYIRDSGPNSYFIMKRSEQATGGRR